MTISSRTRAIAAVAGLALLLSPSLSATERKPLPQFSVLSLSDQFVDSSTFVLQRNWLMLLVRPDCAPCDRLLAAIPREFEGWPSRVVVIVIDADLAATAAYAARFPDLSGARWYADQSRQSYAVSTLPGTPIMFGLRNNVLEWSLVGLAPDVQTARSAMTTWLRFEQ
jgi:hypothetical protein